MTDHPRRVTRALLVRFRQDRPDRIRQRAGGAWRRAGLHRRHREVAPRRADGHRRFRCHRLSRNDGRPRENAAPENPRRTARVRDNPEHVDAMKAHGIVPIDLWWSTSIRSRKPSPRPTFDEGIENIDIGGPAMIRAAAKNHEHVAVVVAARRLRRPARRAFAANGTTTCRCAAALPRRRMRTAAYDARSRTGSPFNSRTTRP